MKEVLWFLRSLNLLLIFTHCHNNVSHIHTLSFAYFLHATIVFWIIRIISQVKVMERSMYISKFKLIQSIQFNLKFVLHVLAEKFNLCATTISTHKGPRIKVENASEMESPIDSSAQRNVFP